MDDPIKKKLYDFMVERGVDPFTAEEAAQNCSRAMERRLVAGLTVGFMIFAATKDPLFVFLGAVGGGAGSVMALGWSPSCAEVRKAADFWSDYEGIR